MISNYKKPFGLHGLYHTFQRCKGQNHQSAHESCVVFDYFTFCKACYQYYYLKGTPLDETFSMLSILKI